VQTTPVLQAHSHVRQPPGATKIRPRVGLKTKRAVLQHRVGPAQPVAAGAGQQERVVKQQDVFREARRRVVIGGGGHLQQAASQIGAALSGALRQMLQNGQLYIAVGVLARTAKGLAGKHAGRRPGGDSRAPQPAGEQLVWQALGPLWPQCRLSMGGERFENQAGVFAATGGDRRAARRHRHRHRNTWTKPAFRRFT